MTKPESTAGLCYSWPRPAFKIKKQQDLYFKVYKQVTGHSQANKARQIILGHMPDSAKKGGPNHA